MLMLSLWDNGEVKWHVVDDDWGVSEKKKKEMLRDG